MKPKVFTCLLLLILAGCGEHRDHVGSNVDSLLNKLPITTQDTKEAVPTGQVVPQMAAPPAAPSRGAGLVRIPEPSVADVVGLPHAVREQGRQVSNESAAKRNKVTSEETFDVIKENAAKMRSLDSYFSSAN